MDRYTFKVEYGAGYTAPYNKFHSVEAASEQQAIKKVIALIAIGKYKFRKNAIHWKFTLKDVEPVNGQSSDNRGSGQPGSTDQVQSG